MENAFLLHEGMSYDERNSKKMDQGQTAIFGYMDFWLIIVPFSYRCFSICPDNTT